MLLRRAVLERIESGEITVVFRRWRRPTVRSGGTLTTAGGVLAIHRVEPTIAAAITARDARAAGYASRRALLDELDGRDGTLYRIVVSHAGADSRVALRERDTLSDADVTAIRARLDRLDTASPVGAWTRTVLDAIAEHPHRPARELAVRVGLAPNRLKTNVRKLKGLGLTVSHHPGYSLSARGAALLARLAVRSGTTRPRGPGPS